ncbi:hypothetical protein HBH74_158710 [Parastagonospora nodorum]|nr:hypothetical protein HBH74_158710 [Parastagonospora nodorum]KAH4915995.1 hypothetical protein HBH73_236970 [Parastagonospora nodorum]
MSFWDRPKKGSSIRKATNSTPPSTGDTPMHSPSPGREQSSRQSQLNHRNSRQPHEGAAIHPIERSTRRSPEYVQEARAATYGQAPASTYGAPEYSGSASRSQGYVPPSPLLQTSYNGPPSQANYRGNTQASTQPAYPGYASLLNDNIQPSPLSRDSYVGPPSQQNYQGNTQASTQAPSQPYDQQDPFQNRTKLDPKNFRSEKQIKGDRKAEQARTRVRPTRERQPVVPKPPKKDDDPRAGRVRKPYVSPYRPPVPQQNLVPAPTHAMAPQRPIQPMAGQGPASSTYSLAPPPKKPKADKPRAKEGLRKRGTKWRCL